MAWAMLPRAIWLGSRPAFAGAATSIAINSAYFLSQKNGISREHAPFWSVPGRRSRCRALSTRYWSPTYRPRVMFAAAPAPSEPEDGRGAAHARATPRRDDAAARAQMNEITPRRTSRNHRRLAHLRHYPAPGSIDWTRRASATEMRGNLGVQHQFARHLQKHRRAGGHGTDCNWAPQRRPCFPRGLLLVTAPRNSGTPRCAYAQCPKVKRIARRVLYPAENWCCSSARSVSRRWRA